MNADILKIGRVIEVSGAHVVGELESSIEDLIRTYKSRVYEIGQIGSIVKLETLDRLNFGIVTQLRMEEIEGQLTGRKVIHIDLIGEGRKTGLREGDFIFSRGSNNFPLLGSKIYAASSGELSRIFVQPDESSISIGKVAFSGGGPAFIKTNDLLGRHFALLGNTGSGKSGTLALLVRRLIEAHQFARIIIIDPHDEYSRAFTGKVEKIDPTEINLPHWLLNAEEAISLFTGRSERAATTLAGILKGLILECRREGQLPEHGEWITVDTPVPYSISSLADKLRTERKGKNVKDGEPYEKLLDKIDALMNDKRYSFLFDNPVENMDSLKDIMSKIFRIPTDGRPISVIDVSGVPSEVIDMVIAVLCRLLFSFCVWKERDRNVPILLVCEEAHRYIPRNSEATFDAAKNALAVIAKEGRKYGLSLGIVSQRPSELAESVVTQCGTIFALRLSNERDQAFVERAMPDGIKRMVDLLPALRSKEGLVVGEGVSVPMRVQFDELKEEHRPRGENVDFAKAWSSESDIELILSQTIERWRKQKRG